MGQAPPTRDGRCRTQPPDPKPPPPPRDHPAQVKALQDDLGHERATHITTNQQLQREIEARTTAEEALQRERDERTKVRACVRASWGHPRPMQLLGRRVPGPQAA
jgi:hypothetical protein